MVPAQLHGMNGLRKWKNFKLIFIHRKMKKIISIFIVGCLLITSCKDDSNDPVVQSSVNKELKSEQNPCNGYPPQNIVTDFLYLGHVFCTYPCMNCYYPVSIVANSSDSQYLLYQSFINSYENNNLGDFFNSQNWNLIFPDLDQNTIDKILSGDYKIVIKESSDGTATKMFIIMKAEGDESLLLDDDIIVVLQIKLV